MVDSGPKRDSRGRRVSDQTRRAELLAAYDRSGQTQKAFAQREGVNVHTFVSWLQQRRRSLASAATSPAVQFAELLSAVTQNRPAKVESKPATLSGSHVPPATVIAPCRRQLHFPVLTWGL